jgi:hypothetical protein
MLLNKSIFFDFRSAINVHGSGFAVQTHSIGLSDEYRDIAVQKTEQPPMGGCSIIA